MASQATSLEARIEALERQLRTLSDRVQALELERRRRAEHPVDQTAVRNKVTYDWQS